MLRGDFPFRMDGISMHGEAGNLQPARMDRVEKCLRLLIAREQRIGIAVVRAAESAGADLDRLLAHFCEVIERLLELHGAKDDGEDAEFHFGMVFE